MMPLNTGFSSNACQLKKKNYIYPFTFAGFQTQNKSHTSCFHENNSDKWCIPCSGANQERSRFRQSGKVQASSGTPKIGSVAFRCQHNIKGAIQFCIILILTIFSFFGETLYAKSFCFNFSIILLLVHHAQFWHNFHNYFSAHSDFV